jgi:uroporphyrinogen-III synthase
MTAASSQPLAGRRVVVTRTREQASVLTDRLTRLGAEVLELPVLRITGEISKPELADCLLELARYDWIVFTSGNGVHFFFEEFFRLFEDIRSLGFTRIAAVGDGTSRGLKALHLKVECQPQVATAEGLADALIATGSLDNAQVLVITGNRNRETLVTKLEGEGRAIVDQLQVYKTESTDLTDHPAAADYRARGADVILFASSSSAEFFQQQAKALQLAPGARRPLAGSIGPQTSAALKRCGIPVAFEAEQPGFDGLLAALVKQLGRP